ncbi:MAG TPA: hypothetical protein VMM60_09295, partial [Ilumatobacter sp.]|nr:hypothetical protein [Ilumatobacter sp.]
MRRSRAAVGVVSLVALGATSVAYAAITRIDEPATVGEVAIRPTPGGTSVGGGPPPTIGGCDVFPADNPWNQRVDDLPLRADSAAMVARIQSVGGDNLHPDFGENPDYGIPFVVVPADQPLVPVAFTAYGDESDPGPYPVPLDAPVEGGSNSDGDRHVLAVQQGTCDLFELYRAFPVDDGGGRWEADSGARFDLSSNDLRPLGWTSADAAGLPVLAGLIRYDEVAAGEIRHAIRVTFSQTQRAYVLPATHWASSRTDALLPPMGVRLRLSALYDVSQLTGQARVIAEAMQRYGLIVADNGSNWYFQGAPSTGWNDD